MKNNILYVVVPCYNEEDVLDETSKRLEQKFNNLIKLNIINKKSKVLFVNDGSRDKTWDIIKKLHKKNSMFAGISLSRNRGHQNALLAGLMTAKKYANVVVSMDADLQDDINAMDEMLKKYYEGAEIVYGVRSARKKDTIFKRKTAESFYKIMKLLGVDIIYNHADYRLTSKNVLNKLEEYKESNLFLRGIFPLLGYKSEIVYYERSERFAGESKYPIKKMIKFAWDGITSFSTRPILYILLFGIFLLFATLVSLITLAIINIYNPISSWIFIVLFIFNALAINLISLGIVGEYVGKTYIEVKNRPRYFISEVILNEE